MSTHPSCNETNEVPGLPLLVASTPPRGRGPPLADAAVFVGCIIAIADRGPILLLPSPTADTASSRSSAAGDEEEDVVVVVVVVVVATPRPPRYGPSRGVPERELSYLHGNHHVAERGCVEEAEGGRFGGQWRRRVHRVRRDRAGHGRKAPSRRSKQNPSKLSSSTNSF